jgi:hypothetical protein
MPNLSTSRSFQSIINATRSDNTLAFRRNISTGEIPEDYIADHTPTFFERLNYFCKDAEFVDESICSEYHDCRFNLNETSRDLVKPQEVTTRSSSETHLDDASSPRHTRQVLSPAGRSTCGHPSSPTRT